MTEFVIALGIFAAVMVPIGYSYARHHQMVADGYHRAVIMEILDGEMELLRAGAWQTFQPGTNDYPVRARAAANLPPGHFQFIVAEASIRLEWLPRDASKSHAMKRESFIR